MPAPSSSRSGRAHAITRSSRWHLENLPFFHTPGLDQVLNSVLIYLRPTNAPYARVLFFATALTLGVAYACTLRFYKEALMSRSYMTLTPNSLILRNLFANGDGTVAVDGVLALHVLYLLVTLRHLFKYRRYFAPAEDWENPQVFAKKRVAMHTSSIRYISSVAAARAHACRIELRSEDTPNIASLDGTWRFQYTEDPGSAKDLLWAKKKPSHKDWSSIPVPSNWQLSTNFDRPIYTNIQYPFPLDPPHVPSKNPTGLYQRTFTLPSSFFSSPSLKTDGYRILFHGVSSAFYAHVNGEVVGYSQDSCLPAEFDVTKQISLGLLASGGSRTTAFTLDVIVIRWSDGSYLEDQDHWWLSGIPRSVELIRVPSGADVEDFAVQADMDGHVETKVKLRSVGRGERRGTDVTCRIFGDVQTDVEGGCKKGEQVYKITATVTAADSSVTLSGYLPSPSLWTAETPNLYTLTVELTDASGTVLQCESQRIGFKTVDITREGVLTVNSKKVYIAGVNRHDHDPDTGKTITIPSLIKDITILKAANFNSIRTSHYPNTTEFYKLCDFLGMYVVDEGNVETHGCK